MKIHLVSDLHTEFAPYPNSFPKGTDLVVAAGDIAVADKGPLLLREMFGDYVPIVYVCGNHEFYRQRIVSNRKAIEEEATRLKVNCLENSLIRFGDVVIIGATLWTNYLLYGEGFRSYGMQQAAQGMNDFRLINCDESENGWTRFLPKDAIKLHEESVAFICTALEENKGLKTVVVSHMAPHRKSIYARYENDALNCAYASDLTGVIEKYKPNLWLHGHMHNSFDYMVDQTRIVCNPRGYASRVHLEDNENKNFNKDLLLEI